MEHYSKAIDLQIKTKHCSVYYSNRAACHLKMENYGLAIIDCDEAINLNKDNQKAYYRKADGKLLLVYKLLLN